MIRVLDRFLNSRLNLFSPDYEIEIKVFKTVDGDIQVFAPNPRDRQAVMEMCDLLVRSAHILGARHGLRLNLSASEKEA